MPTTFAGWVGSSSPLTASSVAHEKTALTPSRWNGGPLMAVHRQSRSVRESVAVATDGTGQNSLGTALPGPPQSAGNATCGTGQINFGEETARPRSRAGVPQFYVLAGLWSNLLNTQTATTESTILSHSRTGSPVQ